MIPPTNPSLPPIDQLLNEIDQWDGNNINQWCINHNERPKDLIQNLESNQSPMPVELIQNDMVDLAEETNIDHSLQKRNSGQIDGSIFNHQSTEDKRQRIENESRNFITLTSADIITADKAVASNSKIYNDIPSSNIEKLIDNLGCLTKDYKDALKAEFPHAKFYDCKSLDYSVDTMINAMRPRLRNSFIDATEDKSEEKVLDPKKADQYLGLTDGKITAESKITIEKSKKSRAIEGDFIWAIKMFNLLFDNDVDSLRERMDKPKITIQTLHRPKYCGLLITLLNIHNEFPDNMEKNVEKMEKNVDDFCNAHYPDLEKFYKDHYPHLNIEDAKKIAVRYKYKPGIRKFSPIPPKKPIQSNISGARNFLTILAKNNDSHKKQHDFINFIKYHSDGYRMRVGAYVRVSQDTDDGISEDRINLQGLKAIFGNKTVENMYKRSTLEIRDFA